MISHAPPGYACPFCAFLAGGHTAWNTAQDLLVREEQAFAFLSPKWWPENCGAALVLPTSHYENLYDIPPEIGAAVWSLTQRVAMAMKLAYACEGTSTRQHNEPAGNQDVWHLHVHVLPRYAGDDLYRRHAEARWVPLEERQPYAQRLRAALSPSLG